MSINKEIVDSLEKINANIERLIAIVVKAHNFRAPWYQSIALNNEHEAVKSGLKNEHEST